MSDSEEHARPGDLAPERPEDAGVAEERLSVEEVEPAHMLANSARSDLRRAGFSDDQIDEWARAFLNRFSAGDEQEFLDWIAAEEGINLPRR